MSKKIIYFLTIGFLFLLSFFFYSSLRYPALNSDNAVSVLMIYYFKLPHDFYFWGQDRLGSLIPMLGQVPFRLFNLSALASETVIHYLILLAGFLAFSSFFKSNFYKILFAVVWFFPPMHLIDVTQFAFGIHYSLIAIACYLVSLSKKITIQQNPILKHVIFFFITIILIAAIWVSDMALVSVGLLLGILLFYYLWENKLTRAAFRNPQLYYAIFGIIAGYLFIRYAKSFSEMKNNYSVFGNIHTIKQTIIIFLNTLSDLLLFKAKEPFTSLYTYLVIIVIGHSLFMLRKVKMDRETKKWALFFFLDACFLFSIIIISKWTFMNNVPRRYFTCTYIAFSFVLLLMAENLVLSKNHTIFLKYFLLLTIIIGGSGTLYNLKYIWPKTLTPAVKIVGEFQQLGKIGLISEYWNSYITSCINPEMIKATPHDKTWAVRNYKIVDEVFEQKKIYLIKDMWLESFPDTINQFGRTLVKAGHEFRIGNCTVCQYRKMQ